MKEKRPPALFSFLFSVFFSSFVSCGTRTANDKRQHRSSRRKDAELNWDTYTSRHSRASPRQLARPVLPQSAKESDGYHVLQCSVLRQSHTPALSESLEEKKRNPDTAWLNQKSKKETIENLVIVCNFQGCC